MASPQHIGRYELRTELGRGGMATVYRAFDPRFRREVAVKVLPREFLHDPMFRARFEREAQTIAGLEHYAIVPVYDFGEHEGQPYLVMRYMPGGSLADLIMRGPLSLADAAGIITPIAAALDAAHDEGVIHRDVKPANILFSKRRQAHLTDFGIVKLTEATAQLTGSGLVGTPAYMAPEMTRKGGTGPLVDVYALGVTAFQMLTGQLPYEADTPMGTALAHITTPIPDIREARPDLPGDVQTVIERALAKDPADRTQSAGDLADALRALAAGEPLPAEAGPPASAPQARPVQPSPHSGDTLPPESAWEGRSALDEVKKRRSLPGWAWIGGAVVVVALLVVGAAWQLGWLPAGDAAGGAAEVPPVLTVTEVTTANSTATEEAPNPIGSSSTDQLTPTATQTLTPTPTNESPTATPSLLESGYRLFQCGDDLCIGHMNSVTKLGLTGQFTYISGYSWSPDGNQIVFDACAGAQLYCPENLYLVSRDGSNLTSLLSGSTTNTRFPAWSPDGEWIAYHESGALKLIRPDKSEILTIEHNMANNPACPYDIAWSPDSQRLAWVGGICMGPDNETQESIWVAKRDGTEKHMIYQTDTFELTRFSLGWSPDGDSIAARLENGDVITVDANCYALANGCDDSSWSIIPELPEHWLHTFYPQWAGEEIVSQP